MKGLLLLLLVCSILLIVVSSWSINAMIRLHDASKTTSNMENSCHVSTGYIKTSITVFIGILVVSLVVFLVSGIKLFKNGY